jgi:hypothetical protein
MPLLMHYLSPLAPEYNHSHFLASISTKFPSSFPVPLYSQPTYKPVATFLSTLLLPLLEKMAIIPNPT